MGRGGVGVQGWCEVGQDVSQGYHVAEHPPTSHCPFNRRFLHPHVFIFLLLVVALGIRGFRAEVMSACKSEIISDSSYV